MVTRFAPLQSILTAVQIDEQLKHQLARELCAILDGWTLTQASTKMRVHRARISELRHNKLRGFSISRLVRLIACHGYDIELSLRPMEPPTRPLVRPSAAVVRYDRFGRPQNGDM